MAQDWYPKTQAALIPWHDNFSTQAAINGTTLGLTAPQVTQIAADAANVLTMLNGLEAANTYRQALTEYKNLLFSAPADTPTEPRITTIPGGAHHIEANSKNARVLFVDDEERILTALRSVFRTSYHVFTATNGPEALEFIKKFKPLSKKAVKVPSSVSLLSGA